MLSVHPENQKGNIICAALVVRAFSSALAHISTHSNLVFELLSLLT